jgi:hypothetical protein
MNNAEKKYTATVKGDGKLSKRNTEVQKRVKLRPGEEKIKSSEKKNAKCQCKTR